MRGPVRAAYMTAEHLTYVPLELFASFQYHS
jgi:hypothetical protein